MNNTDPSKFTCGTCENHELIVTHVWIIEAGQESERWREWGPLKDDHHWRYEFKERIEEDNDEVRRGDFGPLAEDDSDSEAQDYEIHEPQSEREDDEFFVNCGYCDREIEFGWSQPDRRGLILPVEFSDFVASESWPDPKYVDAWQQRGWLRTDPMQT